MRLQHPGRHHCAQELVHPAIKGQRLTRLEPEDARANREPRITVIDRSEHYPVLFAPYHAGQQHIGQARQAPVQLVINQIVKQRRQRLPRIHPLAHVEDVSRGVVDAPALVHGIVYQHGQPLDFRHRHIGGHGLESLREQRNEMVDGRDGHDWPDVVVMMDRAVGQRGCHPHPMPWRYAQLLLS